MLTSFLCRTREIIAVQDPDTQIVNDLLSRRPPKNLPPADLTDPHEQRDECAGNGTDVAEISAARPRIPLRMSVTSHFQQRPGHPHRILRIH